MMNRFVCRLGIGVATLAALLSFRAMAHNGDQESFQYPELVKIVTVKVGDRYTTKQLVDLGFNIAGVDLKAGTVDLILDPSRDFSFANGRVAMLGVQDLQIVRDRALNTMAAPDSEYKNPQEIASIMRQFADDYPGITRLESIGRSVEGRDIWALKISDNPNERELDEPTVLFNGMHHAREIMTPEVPLDIIEYLVTKYGSDPQVTRWVEESEIWVVPMLNPDGNNKVWNGSNMWRKNTGSTWGVDLNRNYPYRWGECRGSSGFMWSDTYRGPSAGSEPETQALMGLVARIEPVFDISYHSYSELVLYPYGCNNERTETADVVEGVGQEMARMLPSDTGNGHYTPGTPWDILYAVDGDDISWMYNVYNVIPYVIELNHSNQGFQPPYSWRQRTVEKQRAAWGLLLDKLEQSGIRGVVRNGDGSVLPAATVEVRNLGNSGNRPFTWKVKNDGTYHLVLNPGMYRLTFRHGGSQVVKEVTVGTERLMEDIEL